ncbi:MAG TPA: hypothetical protein VGS10_04555 [Terracidiphilus sp.]|nr:hypothetical protein [Terracidiphilus sp.]
MGSIPQTVAARPVAVFTGRNSLLDRYFYLAMSLLSAAVVVWGFGHTVDQSLFHPAVPRPRLLWFHGAVFSAWILFFIFQSTLVRTRNVRLHRLMGWFGAALGTLMVPLGIATAIVMVHFETYTLHETGRYAFFIVPSYDMLAFGTCFALAIIWRKQPEFHRRLIFLATCALLIAAFARFSPFIRSHGLGYLGVDGMVALGLLRDLLVNRRVHKVYRVVLPAFLAAQSIVIYVSQAGPQWWIRIARAVVG